MNRPMDTQVKSGMGARFHAWLMAHAGPRYDRMTRQRKQRLLGGLRGNILEIGPGTGPNLRYFAAGGRWLGVEPNPHMSPHLARAMANANLVAEIRWGVAESLPIEDESQDAVVSTLVLCSVCDPASVLREVRRVLKPGGQFVFFEHVAAPGGTWLRRWQDWLRPFSLKFADGCHPNRETGQLIESAGFSRVELEHFRLPLGPVAPQIAGRAIR
jgi:SAM-dependent methyltransferase